MIQLAGAAEPWKPRVGDAPTWRDLSRRLAAVRVQPQAVRRERRQAEWQLVASAEAGEPLPERFQLHELLHQLHDDGGPWARAQLLQIIAGVPLRWGPWKALKSLFKTAERTGDRELFGALAARFDLEYARGTRGEIQRPTLRYLVRRAWRHLRQLGVAMPSAYPDAASAVLQHYPADAWLRRSWIANHIFHHELSLRGGRAYSRSQFKRVSGDLLADRAFPEAWRRSPRPLFSLLEAAQHETVRRFAAESLQADFRTQLREVEPSWVSRLLTVRSASVDRFVVWLLENVPRFEQGALRELGLHAPVLTLLDSEDASAASWAASYARSHARDLELERLIRLANADHKDVRRLARDLLRSRDPRKEVGLDAWGRLLGTRHGHDLASEILREHFGPRELTLDWFADRLLSGERKVVEFASERLVAVHGKRAPAPFFAALLDHSRVDALVVRVAAIGLEARGTTDVDDDILRRALLNPVSRDLVQRWVREDRVAPTRLGVALFKSLADERHFATDPFIAAVRSLDRPWAAELRWDVGLQAWALGLLADARTFSADDVGFVWLFDLVQRTDRALHRFAVETLTRSFHPSHFVDPDQRDDGPAEPTPAGEIEADLQQKSFLFTGKLATMTRSQAQKMLIAANGRKASAVNGSLDFLVIGDEGSPLYGGGRKGSKQVKAESLIEKGADLKIISETAFLQMLAGESVEVDEDAALAGAERLWGMLVSEGPVDAPLRSFALHYLRRHHAGIHMEETDRPLDPGAELPDVFLTFERAAELVADRRGPLRELGLLWMRWELAHWNPPVEALIPLCELPHTEVRELVELALTADDGRAHRRYRLDPDGITPEAAYRFCGSAEPGTRALGLKLIALHPRLAIPEELFRLTESPDRQVRAFVIRQLWTLYRDRGTSRAWTPPIREGEEPSPARPEAWPAEQEDVRTFLRRTLFGIPPARLPTGGGGVTRMPAWKAKVALIEVCRDLALEEPDFAARVLPLFDEFVASGGRLESEACLVASMRIRARHGETLGGRA